MDCMNTHTQSVNQIEFNPAQVSDRAEFYPSSTKHEAGIHASPSQDTVQHTPKGQLSVADPPTDFSVLLLSLVEVHDAMNDLYRRVATEE